MKTKLKKIMHRLTVEEFVFSKKRDWLYCHTTPYFIICIYIDILFTIPKKQKEKKTPCFLAKLKNPKIGGICESLSPENRAKGFAVFISETECSWSS